MLRKQKLREVQRKRASNIIIDQNPITTESIIELTPITSKKSPYQRPQSFGKAARRSVRSFPNSPTKRTLVVASLFKPVGLNLMAKMKAIFMKDSFQEKKKK